MTDKGQYVYDYPRPMVTVDAVVLAPRAGRLDGLFIKRKNPPFEGWWALPGGFINTDETLVESCARELREETGIEGVELMQLAAFGDPGRDPRGRTVGVAFMALICAEHCRPQAADDAVDVAWLPAYDLPRLAFDHNQIVEYALTRIHELAEIRGLGAHVLEGSFAMEELARLYDALLNTRHSPETLRDRLETRGIIAPEDSTRQKYCFVSEQTARL
jgi:8-oxo-dGTP diphosphatase